MGHKRKEGNTLKKKKTTQGQDSERASHLWVAVVASKIASVWLLVAFSAGQLAKAVGWILGISGFSHQHCCPAECIIAQSETYTVHLHLYSLKHHNVPCTAQISGIRTPH